MLSTEQRHAIVEMLALWERHGRIAIAAAVMPNVEGVRPELVMLGQASDEDYLGFSSGHPVPVKRDVEDRAGVAVRYFDLRDLAIECTKYRSGIAPVTALFLHDVHWASEMGEPFVRDESFEAFWQGVVEPSRGVRRHLAFEAHDFDRLDHPRYRHGLLRAAKTRAVWREVERPTAREMVWRMAVSMARQARLSDVGTNEGSGLTQAHIDLVEMLRTESQSALDEYPLVRRLVADYLEMSKRVQGLELTAAPEVTSAFKTGVQGLFWLHRRTPAMGLCPGDGEQDYRVRGRDLQARAQSLPESAALVADRQPSEAERDESDAFLLN